MRFGARENRHCRREQSGGAGPGVHQIVKMPGILRRTRAYLEFTLRPPGYFVDSSILPQILPQTSSQTQGNSRVSRMEHQTPSVFPGNFRKRKVLGTLCFPFCLPEKYVKATELPHAHHLAKRGLKTLENGICLRRELLSKYVFSRTAGV